MKMYLPYILLFIFSNSYADSLREPKIETKIVKSTVLLSILPPEKAHFNTEAPNHLLIKNKSLKPSELTSSNIIFKLNSTKETDLKFYLYYCDEAKTYCAQKIIQKHWNGLHLNEINSKEETKLNSIKSSGIKKDEFGFIMNDIAAAKDLAEKTHRSILIDFYAIWCPPCNQLDEEVYSTEKFKELSKSFILVKLDADTAVSWELKTKYKITGYPTIIFANSKFEEITRFIGFYNLTAFEKTFKLVNKYKNIEEVITKAKTGDESAAKILGDYYFNKKEFSESIKAYKSPYDIRRAELEQDKLNSTPSKELLQKTIKEFPNSLLEMDSNIALAEMFEKNSGEFKSYWHKAIEIAESLISKFQGRQIEDSDVTAVDLMQTIAGGYEDLNDVERSHKAYNQAVQAYQKKFKNNIKHPQRSIALELAFCLWKAGNLKKATSIYNEYIKQYPKDFTFYFAKSRMNFHLKNFTIGLNDAIKAHELSYGDNKLRATENLAKYYIELKQNQKAIETIKSTMASAEKPSNPEVRTNRYIATLEKLLKTLND